MGYVYDALENHFIRNDTPNEGIPQLMWHITNRCKLDCKFCFSKKNEDEIIIKDLNQYIQKFRALKVQKIDLSGGEPLLHSDFSKICEALFKEDIGITITTRSAGLETNVEWILDNWERFARIIVSLDVPSMQQFKELTNNKGAWDKTIDLLHRLRDKQCTNVRVNTVVTTYLLNTTYLEQLAKIIGQSFCKEWCLIETHPANKKETYDEVTVAHAQFENVIEKAKALWEKIPERRLLVREQANYSDYWVLYPDGILAKHTKGEQDIGNLDFLNTANDIILDMIKDQIWIPEEKI